MSSSHRNRIVALSLLALLPLPGCASLVPHRGKNPGHARQTPCGLYALTMHSSDTGSLAAVVAAEPTEDGNSFRANGRPGALGQLLGGFKGFVANLASKGKFAGGACLHWTGTYDSQTNVISGRLVTPMAVMRTEGPWTENRLQLLTEKGTAFGWMELTPTTPEDHPRTDLTELIASVERCMRENLYDPALLDSPGTRRYLRELRRVSNVARDDAEFLMGAWVAAGKLPFSHVRLYRGLESPDPAEFSSDSSRAPQAVGSSIQLDFVDDGAILRIDSFAIDERQIHDAFAHINERKPCQLVIDLRRNSGGSYVAMQVAAHLLAEPAQGGVLFGQKARPDVLMGRLEAFPSVARIESVDELHRLLEQHGAIVARIEPVSPRYDGPVAILTSRRTASACEPLVYHLQSSGRAMVLGEPTAGAMLSARTFDVGQGWRLGIPVHDYVASDGVRLERKGVQPDLLLSGDDLPGQALRILARGE